MRLFYGNSGAKKLICFFCSAIFTFVLKLRDEKQNLSGFFGSERSFGGKNPTDANFDGNLINRSICKIFALSRVVDTGLWAPFYG